MDRILHIAVDVQKCYFQRNLDSMGFNECALETARRIKQFALSPQVTTMWVMMTGPHSKLRPFNPQLISCTDQVNMDGLGILPDENLYQVMPRIGDFVINKEASSASSNPLFLPFILDNQFSQIVVSGAYIGVCAGSTFLDVCRELRSTPTAMLTDLVGALFPENYNDELKEIRDQIDIEMLGGKFMTSGDFLETLKEKPAPPAKATPVSKGTKPVT